MSSIICTLYENHYQLGVGSLINSLVNHNFKGKIAVGYRGSLPSWLSQMKNNENSYFISEAVEINFYPLETNYHLAYYKPFLILRLFEEYSKYDNVFYFDPDICNKCDWKFYEKWVDFGLAVCLDSCYGIMPSRHPWRCEWLQLGKELDYEPKQTLDYYFNSGFIGVKRSDVSVLRIWKELTIALAKSNYDAAQMKKIARENSIVGDQDILNAAIAFSDVKCSPIGPEGMDFVGGGFLMSHAVDPVKPWRKQFTLDLLATGKIPSIAETEFFKNLMYPIKLFTPVERLAKNLDLKLAKMLGRIIGH